MNVVANAIYYNPVLALQQLQQQGRLQHFFATWFQVSDTLLHFPRNFLSRVICQFALLLPDFESRCIFHVEARTALIMVLAVILGTSMPHTANLGKNTIWKMAVRTDDLCGSCHMCPVRSNLNVAAACTDDLCSKEKGDGSKALPSRLR